jgi:hypothetical protein
MTHSRYLGALGIGVATWFALYLGFTSFIDPFGISPMSVSVSRVNVFKPRRVDIDRLIKPYEVWRYQPRTVFLGTSRIHQSLDPAVLDGTRFALAYNASIPAGSLGLNISHLKQYLEFDPQLRTVVVELFIYNFLGQAQEHPPKDFREYLRNTANLFVSGDTLWAAVQTLGYNLARTRPAFEVTPRGYYYRPPGHDARPSFDGYPAGIWEYHGTRATGFRIHQPAFEAVRALIELCRQRKLELIFFLTPNHAYDDYYFDAVGAWGAVQEWLTRLSAENATIYSFSQPNAWVYELVSERMLYWNDPYHFSLEMGGAMLRAVSGAPPANAPANFMQRLTPEGVVAHVESRRVAIRKWAAANPEFVAAFASERKRWERSGAAGDPVEASLASLAALRKEVARLHPGAGIAAYKDISGELAPERLVNPWESRTVAQIFPANAWAPGSPPTHNFFFEQVPRKDCSRLVEALGRADPAQSYRINVEPAGKVHLQFPVRGADGCKEGANTVGYTVKAE